MGENTSTEVDERDPATAFMQDAVPILGHMGVEVLDTSASRASVRIPHAANSNHVGTVYAGSLLSAAEVLGGSIGFAQGLEGFVPIVSRMEIDYLRPATSDVTSVTTISEDERARIRADAERDGKAKFVLEITLTDASGTEVARALGHYQLRRFG